MSEATTLRGRQPDAPAQSLACRLRRKEVIGRQGLVPNMGEVELENLSAGLLEIPYWMTALQHLNLVVTDSGGKVVSEGHFGDRFAPTREPQVLRLAPGEKYTANVHLFATAPHALTCPGTYAVRAVYETDGFRAASDPVEVTV
jgi:hypothetical protein